MDTLALLTRSFEDLHQSLEPELWSMDDDDYWWQPGPAISHAGFIAWHIVRDEDDVISHLAGKPQLWLADGWHGRFGLPAEGQGTGFDPARLETLRYDRGLLRAYAQAVWAGTATALASLAPSRLAEPAWPESEWDGGRLLTEGCLCHAWAHLGEVRVIRGLRGWRAAE